MNEFSILFFVFMSAEIIPKMTGKRKENVVQFTKAKNIKSVVLELVLKMWVNVESPMANNDAWNSIGVMYNIAVCD